MIRRLLYLFCAWRAARADKDAGMFAAFGGAAFSRGDRESMLALRQKCEESCAIARAWRQRSTRWYPRGLVVHYSDWADQPDVRIACDQSYARPTWQGAETAWHGVYRREDKRLYAFDEALVTCEPCRVIAAREASHG
jgi:hypothetical protein